MFCCAYQANLLVQFGEDALLDQSARLAAILEPRCGSFGEVGSATAARQFQRLPGNHGTPNDFNPGDTAATDDETGLEVTAELCDLADAVAGYLTERALAKRSAEEENSSSPGMPPRGA